ncbi:multiple monosaccharide ABC transporter permease [Haloglycomyces albus]|uniref:multiple monosaccharide ABC transporter permease n=1 Tax=Haloglycomyces albus TaxID=526067 RepID=UPI00046D73E0|nr:multiple monosaccharide ABC transporter permease [Haloglycomyces albus]
MNGFRTALARIDLRQYGMVIALACIVLLFQILQVAIQNSNFITPINLTNVITQTSYILILAIGMMLVIINGHIDLSVGSVLAFCGAVSAISMASWGFPWWAAVLVAIVTGAVIGAWQGLWVAYVGVPAFIVTLAGMLIFRGLTLAVTDAKSIAVQDETYRMFGSGYWGQSTELAGTEIHLPSIAIGLVSALAVVIGAVLQRRELGRNSLDVDSIAWFVIKNVLIAGVIVTFATMLALHHGIPVVGLLLLGLVLVYTFVTNRTRFGRHIYAGGGNREAAALSGVNTKATSFWVFVNMGALAGLASVVFTARLANANPQAGEMFELDAIASAFIGGASMSGGIGTVIGAVIGGIVMGVMRQGMSILGVGQDQVQYILGLVLLAAVVFDVWNKRRSGVSAPSSSVPRQKWKKEKEPEQASTSG